MKNSMLTHLLSDGLKTYVHVSNFLKLLKIKPNLAFIVNVKSNTLLLDRYKTWCHRTVSSQKQQASFFCYSNRT